MTKMNSQKYCSIDLELTGFDPSKNEIIEVGFVIFTMTKSGPKISKRWSQVFKPSGSVHTKILGLTGISQKELDTAPLFSEHREFLQEALKDVVLVGHGVSLDVRFLEGFGVSITQPVVDTLELAQWLLPTQGGYNLENLMHTLKLKHKEAHRALADSIATIKLLEVLLRIYRSLPEKLQKDIYNRSLRAQFPWTDLLQIPLKPKKLEITSVTLKTKLNKTTKPLPQKCLVAVPLGREAEELWLNSIAQNPETSFIVLPNKAQVIRLWQQGFGEAIFEPEDILDLKKLKSLQKRGDLSLDETKFLFKLLVWQATNWQTASLVDLNLSFFGGQFKYLVNGGKQSFRLTSHIGLTDHKTFLSLKQSKQLKARRLVISDVLSMHDRIAASSGSRVGWGQIIAVLRSIYNPETNTGYIKHQERILEMLAATDLFFGLVLLELSKLKADVILDKVDLVSNDYEYNLIYRASKNYIKKLQKHNLIIKNSGITKIVRNLEKFFIESGNDVQWVEFGQKHCVFITQALDIAPYMRKALSGFAKQAFFDASSFLPVSDYFLGRLGLEGLIKATLPIKFKSNSIEVQYKNLDLVNQLTKYLGVENVPALVLVSNEAEAKEVYNNQFEQLSKYAHIFAQGYSGGGTKIFRNFSIRPNSVLISSSSFMTKAQVPELQVKTVYIPALSSTKSNHPYIKALSLEYPDTNALSVEQIFDLALLVRIFDLVSTNKLKNLFIYGKNDGVTKLFLGFLASLSGLKIRNNKVLST